MSTRKAQPGDVKRVRVRRYQRLDKKRASALAGKPWLVAAALMVGAAATGVSTLLVPELFPNPSGRPAAVVEALSQPGTSTITLERDADGTPLSVQEWVLGERLASRTWGREHLSCTSEFVPQNLIEQPGELSCTADYEPEEPEAGAPRFVAREAILPRPLVENFARPGDSTDRGSQLPQSRLVPFSGVGSGDFGVGGAALVVSDPFTGQPIPGGIGGSGGVSAGSAGARAGGGTVVGAAVGSPTANTTMSGDGSVLEITADAGSTGPVVVGDGEVIGGTDPVPGGLILDAGGLLMPGNSPGTLVVDGALVVNGGGSDLLAVEDGQVEGLDVPRIEIEIGGLIPGEEFDVIQVNGSASFNGGQFDIFFIDGFEADNGDSFEFLTASVLEGADSLSFSVFDLAADLDFEIVIDGTSIAIAILEDPQLTLTVAQNDPQLGQGSSENASSATAPAPATWALMLAGGLLLRIRRRR